MTNKFFQYLDMVIRTAKQYPDKEPGQVWMIALMEFDPEMAESIRVRVPDLDPSQMDPRRIGGFIKYVSAYWAD